MLTITEIKAEGGTATDGSGRSGTVFIRSGFHRQTLAPTHQWSAFSSNLVRRHHVNHMSCR